MLIGTENLFLNSLGGNDILRALNVGGTSDLDNVTINSGGDLADTLIVSSTAIDDRIVYTPTSAAGGTFKADSGATVFHFTLSPSVTSTFTLVGLSNNGDEVVIVGTGSHDVITVDSPDRTLSVAPTQNPSGQAFKPAILDTSVEIASAHGMLGNDTFHVIPFRRQPATSADTPVGPGFLLPTNLLVNIEGGGSASDALFVAGTGGAALAADLFAVVNRGRDADEGVVRVFQDQPGAGNEPFQYPDIVFNDVEVVQPNVAVIGGDPNLLILGPDANEPNEFRANAAFLGSGSVINVVNLSVFPNAFEHRSSRLTMTSSASLPSGPARLTSRSISAR
jgi:hypothetical protein